MDYLAPTACADAYSDAATLGPRFQADHANIQVGASVSDTAAVLYQVAKGKPGDWRWTDEREFKAIPQTFRVGGGIIGIRFRNATAGQTATVQAYLLGKRDPDVQPGYPFTPSKAAAVELVYDSVDAGLVFPRPSVAITVPATYAHLLLVWTARSSKAGAAVDSLRCQFNPSSGYTNYRTQQLYAENATPYAHSSVGDDALILPNVPAAAAVNAYRFGSGAAVLAAYATVGTIHPMLAAFGGHIQGNTVADAYVALHFGLWTDPVAVAELLLFLESGADLVAGSRFSLYGFGLFG